MQFSDVYLETRWPSGLRSLRTSKISEIASGYDKTSQSCFDFTVWNLKIMLKPESGVLCFVIFLSFISLLFFFVIFPPLFSQPVIFLSSHFKLPFSSVAAFVSCKRYVRNSSNRGSADRRTDRQSHRQAIGQTDSRTDGQSNGRTVGRTNDRLERFKHKFTCIIQCLITFGCI